MGLNYKTTEIKNGIARVEYGDGSWAQITLRADMTPEELDDIVYQFGPKPAAAPDFLTTGATRFAQPISEPGMNLADGAAQLSGLDPEHHARLERDRRLASTDFYALSDRTMSAEMASYRQALRDLPATDRWAPQLQWSAGTGVIVTGVEWPELLLD